MSSKSRSGTLLLALIALCCTLISGPRIALAQQGDGIDRWWAQWNDPMLSGLIRDAQTHSANLAQAGLRIEQARAAAVAAGAQARPAVNMNAGAQRGTVQIGTSLLTASQASLSLPSSWELDLFGRVGHGRDAAQARLDSEQAQRGALQVALAAETAAAYLQFRFCEAQHGLVQQEAASRAGTARSLEAAVQAGLAAPVQLAQARSVQADVEQRLIAQATDCEAFLQALGVLSARDLASLRRQLTSGAGQLPQPRDLDVKTLSAALLVQRPDVAAADRAVAAASADLGAARADRYPRLTLNGNIGPLVLAARGVSATLLTWSIGPALSLPLLDGGRRAANEEVARVAYAAAEVRYRETARRAVQEVEEALLRGRAAAERQPALEATRRSQQAIHDAVTAKLSAGLASTLERDETERAMLAADGAALALHRERLAAWLQLYRALGGGWEPTPSGLATDAARKE
ncbi:MAG: efflux transporter outer membrane subunit [Burkholderiaceae bacterium]